jgi:hypothetical protein
MFQNKLDFKQTFERRLEEKYGRTVEDAPLMIAKRLNQNIFRSNGIRNKAFTAVYGACLVVHVIQSYA